MTPARTFRLALQIDSHFPQLFPPIVPLARKTRTGSFNEVTWRRQMHAELDAMLDEIAAERKRAKEGVQPMKRQSRRYD